MFLFHPTSTNHSQKYKYIKYKLKIFYSIKVEREKGRGGGSSPTTNGEPQISFVKSFEMNWPLKLDQDLVPIYNPFNP